MTYALAYLPTAFSSLTLLLQPVVAALLGMIILNEGVTHHPSDRRRYRPLRHPLCPAKIRPEALLAQSAGNGVQTIVGRGEGVG